MKNSKNQKKTAPEFYKKSYKLKIFLTNLKKPEIYRIFKVTGDTTLNVLHDKVLCPIMGWCRNYHAYYFQRLPVDHSFNMKLPSYLRTVGPAYGPESSGAIDMMHSRTHGIKIIDDSDVRVADLLRKKGDKLRYVYDLGDQFYHKIVVQSVDDNYKEGIHLIDGKGACPNEDGHGNWSYAETIEILMDKNHKKYRETLNTIRGSANYGRIRKEFISPFHFDLKKAQKDLQIALRSKESPNDSRNLFTQHFGGGLPHFPKFKESLYKAPKKVCSVCKTDKKIKKCGRCLIVYYCSVDCQKKDYRKHRGECRKAAMNN